LRSHFCVRVLAFAFSRCIVAILLIVLVYRRPA
jgi:hypothetical protein